jgi:hypothetical protein
MKEIENEKLRIGLGNVETRKELRYQSDILLLTKTINLDSMIRFSVSEFGNSSLVVESWLVV